MKNSLSCVALVLSIALPGCLHDDDAHTPPRGIDGLLTGVVTRGGQQTPVFAIVKDGRIMAVDPVALVFYDGPFIRDGDSITSSDIRVYADPTNVPYWIRGYTETAALSAMVTTGQGWDASLTRPGSTEAISLAYDWNAYDQDSSFSFVAGTWSFTEGPFEQTLTVSPDGATGSSNNVNNCVASGQLVLVGEDSNVYGSAPTVSGTQCGALAGSYSGFVTLRETDAPLDTLRVLAAKSDFFSFQDWRRQ